MILLRYGFVFFVIMPAFAAERFADVDLWLPKVYQKQYVTLLDAADKAQADPYCHKLLSGRLIESESTLEHMQFHFRCRTEDKKTFSMQIDGKTLVVTNEYAEKQRELEAKKKAAADKLQADKDAEQSRMDEEARRELQREQSRYWSICRKAMKKRLKLFEKVEVLTEIPPDPSIDEKEFTYLVDFDARSPSRKPLYFSIRCDISSLEEYAVDVFARKRK
ncbi:MAG: hypothetical protein ACRBCI_08845 [Cellvibrionaceae bacterium]